MKRRLVGWSALALLAACSSGSNNNNNTTPDNASAQVASNASGTITSPAGAKIEVPLYAVPLTSTSGTGTMTFSIESTDASNLTPPAGETAASDVYRLGPEGFTFASPVMVTIPVPNAGTSSQVYLNRVDPITGVVKRVPSVYDPTAKTVSAMTSGMSIWGATFGTASNTSDGAVRLINSSTNMWLHSCVSTYQLTYPAADPNPDFGQGAQSAPVGTIGWGSTIVWGLPQGTYTLCCWMNTAGTLFNPPGAPVFWYTNPITVNKANSYPDHATSADIIYSTPPAGAASGACPCTPVATSSPGTGQVQVTLSWFSGQAVDLDLYVTDPSGNTVSYSNTTVASGGTLDRDNRCGNYVDGKPENIFWNTAPAGQYTVVVKWFSGCSGSLSSMPFTVRVVNKTSAKTYSGTVSSGTASVEVVKFTVQ